MIILVLGISSKLELWIYGFKWCLVMFNLFMCFIMMVHIRSDQRCFYAWVSLHILKDEHWWTGYSTQLILVSHPIDWYWQCDSMLKVKVVWVPFLIFNRLKIHWQFSYLKGANLCVAASMSIYSRSGYKGTKQKK